MSSESDNVYDLTGCITNLQDEPLEGLLVRAFDRDRFSSDDFLGQAETDTEGRYRIQFGEESFKPEIGCPDVYIRVYEGDSQLGESPVHRNSGTSIRFDLRVDHVATVVRFNGIPTTHRAQLLGIKQGESSYNVRLLHQILNLLGSPVAEEEFSKLRVGDSTLERVRRVQAQLGVGVDESVLVDEGTTAALTKALEDRGLVRTSRSFTVTGTVKSAAGEAKKRQDLLAFDVDFRGVASYSSIERVANLHRRGGFDFLAASRTDNRGDYRLQFYDWQCRRPDRKRADVVVFAIDGDSVVGHSRLINTDDHSDKRLARRVEVVVAAEDERTEYDALMAELTPFLEENGASLKSIAESPERLAFTAGELDLPRARIGIAARASLLLDDERVHSLLYGMGRQAVTLSWEGLLKRTGDEIREAIEKSVQARIIQKPDNDTVAALVGRLHDRAARHLLDDSRTDEPNTLNVMLSQALPVEEQRVAFVRARASFKGKDWNEFWDEHLPNQPEFQEDPDLLPALRWTQRLTALTGNHQALVRELLKVEEIRSVEALLELEESDWKRIIQKVGTPDSTEGADPEQKAEQYRDMIRERLYSAFPTQSIVQMLKVESLSISAPEVVSGVRGFLSQSRAFSVATSRVHDFEEEIKAIAGEHSAAVRTELMKLQRVYHVSAGPDALRALLQAGLHSAYSIASIPPQSFIKTYSKALGGERAAAKAHSTAMSIGARNEVLLVRTMDYWGGGFPLVVYGAEERGNAKETIEKHIPNVTELFGSPDVCECQHCNSVFSPSAYFVDLLRFLWRGTPNANSASPLQVLFDRRPDLQHLLLTCENANTEVPYIDLANEVMEYYVASGSLSGFKGHNTGEATAEELRASPQNFYKAAYKQLKDATFPFTLPYHQPLDVIRTCLSQLGITHCEIMKAVEARPNSQPVEAEALGLSNEEYLIISNEEYLSIAGAGLKKRRRKLLNEYYGIGEDGNLGDLRSALKFLQQTGLANTELVDLVKTRFINPEQDALEIIGTPLSYGTIDTTTIYSRLEQIATGTLQSANDAQISAAVAAYSAALGTNLSHGEFDKRVRENFTRLLSVITLYEPDSRCDLDTTELKTVQNIYDGSSSSGITDATWSRIHRFIRLWRRLKWSIHETDLMLSALGEADITAGTVQKLEAVLELQSATQLTVSKLAVFWGKIDTFGERCLYQQLFVNRAALENDSVFAADNLGHYLKNADSIADHTPAMLSAFGISHEELRAVLGVAELKLKDVKGVYSFRLLDPDVDKLTLPILSTLYRYVLLAGALKLDVTDLCQLIRLYASSPFSICDVDQDEFADVDPGATQKFYEWALSVRVSGFTAPLLEYVLNGSTTASTRLGLEPTMSRQVVRSIRSTFASIDLKYPESPQSPLTIEAIALMLGATFPTDIVGRFIGIIQDSTPFEVLTDTGLDISLIDDLASKYAYHKKSGRLTAQGVMWDNDRTALKALQHENASFEAAVDELHAAPETFIVAQFSGIFDAPTLLSDLRQDATPDLEAKLTHIYSQLVSHLRSKLRRDAITQHIATLAELEQEIAAVLTASYVDSLANQVSTCGFSAAYIDGVVSLQDPADPLWSSPSIPRTDRMIDFAWGTNTPFSSTQFSVRWRAYVSAPASGRYQLIVEVADPSAELALSIGGEKVLSKTAVELNSADLVELKLDYVAHTGDAGVRLYWRPDSAAQEILPASAAYPSAMIDDFEARISLLHRAAKFIEGFDLSAIEVAHLMQHSSYFGNIDFQALNISHWKRIRDYTELRDAVPQAGALLTDLFSMANATDPTTMSEELRQTLYLVTAWNRTDGDYLVDALQLKARDFCNEIALRRMHKVMKIVSKTGLSAETIVSLRDNETDFDELHNKAQLLKDAVRSKYQYEDWIELMSGLNGALRENQQRALVSYLLTRQDIRDAGVEDVDGLFEHLLIDVQMAPCMNTSRIVQGSAAVQSFVQRVLMNLESKFAEDGRQLSIAPDAIDKDRWEWMKNYRVWEANRKVFLYPENWLEPEWRHDRSEFFKTLEAELVENDITERSVEKALRGYLTSLSEVANLEVCGMWREDTDSSKGTAFKLHVFARTHHTPYKFFYRTWWNESLKWSAWEKVPVDIRSVENGDKRGTHLLPVVWKARLFLFWPEFSEQVEESDTDYAVTANQLAEETISALEPVRHWEVQLAWSEYVDGTWTPKQVSKESIITYIESHYSLENLMLQVHVDGENRLYIHLMLVSRGMYERGYGSFLSRLGQFEFSDITSKIETQRFSGVEGLVLNAIDEFLRFYRGEFQRFVTHESPLQFSDYPYLQATKDHSLLTIPVWHTSFDAAKKYSKFDIWDMPRWHTSLFETPFFYNHADQTYFVRTLPVTFDPDQPPLIIYEEGESVGVEYAPAILEFRTFHHPYSNEFVTRLNQGGLSSLMESSTEITSDTSFWKYQPDRGLVTFPELETPGGAAVRFDAYQPNSLYNWELFFHVPLYIATRLSRNGKYAEAMQWFHFIFDPTTNEAPAGDDNSRYWKVQPFKRVGQTIGKILGGPKDLLEDLARSTGDEHPIIREWRDNPFRPHLVASKFLLPYMTHVVMKYIDNLIAWGDSLFRQFTRESVNEALQIYMIARRILGPKPEFVPRRGTIPPESYQSLERKWDDFSNAVVQFENLFPYSSDAPAGTPTQGPGLLGIGEALYFCIPANEKLLNYWDTVDGRLFKIRHCQDIDGVGRELALLAPPIDPALLIQATSQGLDLGSILSGLGSPPPIFRFTHLLQRTNDFCGEVKQLGSMLLAALEKKDAEELSRLRASHETTMLELITSVRERRILDARSNRKRLLQSRETAKFRLQHYLDLLGETLEVPSPPTLPASLTENTPLPAGTLIQTLQTNVDTRLVESGEAGVKLIPREKEDLDKRNSAKDKMTGVGIAEAISGVAHALPELMIAGLPIGVGVASDYGGLQLGPAAAAAARVLSSDGTHMGQEAALAATMAGYIRREQDWTLQANLAARDIVELDKQIIAAGIQVQIAEKELEQHKQSIKHADEITGFLEDKFSNQELYQWMKEQLLSVYKQSYNLAFDMAKKAEAAYRYELGLETASFIQYGYWSDSVQGLVAGEKLQLALRQLEKSYLEENRRELELRKSISLALLDPLALIELRETGKCEVELPEEYFDLDFQGHYFRRVKSVSLSIPCVAGPYTSISCSLRLLNSSVRVKTTMNKNREYERLRLSDDRFQTSYVPVTSIATSTGQNDAGMFELNFRDERYLPFEGAGAVSRWQIQLTEDRELRQFDYSTIADVVLHMSYTARESGGNFKTEVVDYLKRFAENAADSAGQPFLLMLSMRHEFPTEWHRFLFPEKAGEDQALKVFIGKERFPFFAKDRDVVIEKLQVFTRCNPLNPHDPPATVDYDYRLLTVFSPEAGNPVNLGEKALTWSSAPSSRYGGLNSATIEIPSGHSDPELDVAKEMVLKLRHFSSKVADSTGTLVENYTGLSTNPAELDDLYLVLHYKVR